MPIVSRGAPVSTGRPRTFGRLLGVMLLIAIAGCGEVAELPTAPINDDPVDPSATLSRVQDEVFTPSCTSIGCHDPLVPSEGLVLSAGESYERLVGVAASQLSQLDRVEPGDPDRSYLYWKITGRSGIVGGRMPFGGPPLSEGEVRLVRDWIRRGAPND